MIIRKYISLRIANTLLGRAFDVLADTIHDISLIPVYIKQMHCARNN